MVASILRERKARVRSKKRAHLLSTPRPKKKKKGRKDGRENSYTGVSGLGNVVVAVAKLRWSRHPSEDEWESGEREREKGRGRGREKEKQRKRQREIGREIERETGREGERERGRKQNSDWHNLKATHRLSSYDVVSLLLERLMTEPTLTV
jgi:hypothetical protein